MLKLFILEQCPYSKKVMEYLDKHNIKYKKADVTSPIHHKTLIALGGKEQVPFLYDPTHDVKMYESDDIIKYINKQHKKL